MVNVNTPGMVCHNIRWLHSLPHHGVLPGNCLPLMMATARQWRISTALPIESKPRTTVRFREIPSAFWLTWTGQQKLTGSHQQPTKSQRKRRAVCQLSSTVRCCGTMGHSDIQGADSVKRCHLTISGLKPQRGGLRVLNIPSLISS